MKVLYVSKALSVAAYRDKLGALARFVDVRAVIPERWGGRNGVEPLRERDRALIDRYPAWFHGHNHLHVYRNPRAMFGSTVPDLVHIDEEPYSAVTWQLARACARRRLPFVPFAWQNIWKRLPPPFSVSRRYVLRRAAGAIAGSDAAAAVLRRGGLRTPVTVIPQFGIDPDTFRPDPAARAAARDARGWTPDDFIVGYAGRLVPEKGVDLLCDAVAQLPDATLVIAGDGSSRVPLERRADGKTVRFDGHLESTRMPEWLRALDVLVLPSRETSRWKEQFGRVLVEAMACGVPVVGSTSGEIPRVIGDAGLTVREQDVEALARALGALRASSERRRDLGERGRCRATAEFSHAAIAGRTAAFYHQLLGTS